LLAASCANFLNQKVRLPVRTFHRRLIPISCSRYGIIASLLLVGFTSYFRNKIPYEVFYITHHLVFVMFALAIAHTMDDAARAGKKRSQTFKWFAASLVWYLTDRMFVVMNTEDMEVVESRALGGSEKGSDDQEGKEKGGKVLILRLKRPIHWKFRPGQFASLCASGVIGDPHWHALSIASSPDEATVDFYIEVQGPGSWTDRLWSASRDHDIERGVASQSWRIKVQGPFGVALADFDEYKHIIAVGSGTGLVPMLSLLKSTYSALFRINAEVHSHASVKLDEATREYVVAVKKRRTTLLRVIGSALSSLVPPDPVAKEMDLDSVPTYTKQLVSRMQLWFRLRRLRQSGTQSATYAGLARQRRSSQLAQFGRVSLLALPVTEFAAAVLALSWSVLHHEAEPRGEIVSLTMRYALFGLQVAAVSSFALFWAVCSVLLTFVWWADLIMLTTSGLAITLWWEDGSFGEFEELQRLALVALAAYRFFRVWTYVVVPSDLFSEALRANKESAAALPVDSFKLIFVTRNAFFAQHLWPELDHQWSQLESTWGNYATKVSRITVFCTERNSEARKALQMAVCNTALYRAGGLKFGRPSFPNEMNSHLLEIAKKDQMTGKGVPSTTSTLVAFCGGTILGNTLNDAVNDAVAAVKLVAGESNHAMEFVQENYGHAVVMSKKELAKAAAEAASFEQEWKFQTDDINGPDQVRSVVLGDAGSGRGSASAENGVTQERGGAPDQVVELLLQEMEGDHHDYLLPNQPG